VAGCEIKNVLFPMGEKGLWLFDAYMVLNSVADVGKALAKNGRCMGKSTVKG